MISCNTSELAASRSPFWQFFFFFFFQKKKIPYSLPCQTPATQGSYQEQPNKFNHVIAHASNYNITSYLSETIITSNTLINITIVSVGSNQHLKWPYTPISIQSDHIYSNRHLKQIQWPQTPISIQSDVTTRTQMNPDWIENQDFLLYLALR